jgi:predicted DNA-binding protein (MmcQ/YjbR family)
MTWIQAYERTGLSDKELQDYIAQSYHLVGAGLSKKMRVALGLDV